VLATTLEAGRPYGELAPRGLPAPVRLAWWAGGPGIAGPSRLLSRFAWSCPSRPVRRATV